MNSMEHEIPTPINKKHKVLVILLFVFFERPMKALIHNKIRQQRIQKVVVGEVADRAKVVHRSVARRVVVVEVQLGVEFEVGVWVALV